MSEFEAVQMEAYPAPVFHDVPYPQRPLMVTIAGKYIQLSKHHMPFRTINEYVVILCTDGKGWVTLGDMKTQPVRAGDLLFLPKNTAQSFGCVPNGYWSYIWFHCTGDGADFFYDRFHTQLQTKGQNKITVATPPQAHFYFQSIVESLRDAASFIDLLRIEAIAYQLFCDLLSNLDLFHSPNTNEQLVYTAMKWMESTTQYDITLDELAARFGVSKYHLIRLFKRYGKITPMDYFQQIKLKKSCQLLAQNALSIAEISDQLCYSSPYHFSKMFKLHFGISPSQFKKMISGPVL